MNSEFQKQLRESLYVHYPLRENGKNIERKNLKKKTAFSVSLWDGQTLDAWRFEGEGEARSQDETLKLHTWSRADKWPDSETRAMDAAAGAYATFGSYIARLRLEGRQLPEGNRIFFRIKPECEGLRNPVIRVGFVNDGEKKLPDSYSREGYHAMNLVNHQWNACEWEIDSLPHDKITELSFEIHRYGKDVSCGDNLFFTLSDICIQKVEPNVVHGWKCAENAIAYATTGYLPEGKKTAVLNTEADCFSLLRADTLETVFEGKLQTAAEPFAYLKTADFTPFKDPGLYCLRAGESRTEPFAIAPDLFDSTLWKLTNFLYCERCGYPVPACHGTCHPDVLAKHKGLKLSFAGGWHDAADVSQQTVQTAEVLDGLFAAAKQTKDDMLRLRLLEEANWGLDFILRMRFGDGYRAANASIRRWTDGIQGNMDDWYADVNNRSFENFIFSAVEAEASSAFQNLDPELAWKSLKTAEEDFMFAEERFLKTGVEKPHMEEHTSNASRSQYYAAAVWAAARLYRKTEKESYLQRAEKYAKLLLECQEKGDRGPVGGYFYRDESKETIVHFSHQARDYLFAAALTELCGACRERGEIKKWETALALHGDYLKYLASYASPYGMLPAGIYHISEAENREVFEVLHPQTSFDARKEDYVRQLENGISLGDGYYIRMFPVWFSFRGNFAVMLSMAKAASLTGRYFRDETLLDIAREQLYWTLGKNPFAQSMIYGEGENYGRQYTALLGETVGEIPVGVQTKGNEDLPYWPPAAIATYREVWTTPAGRWMWVAADLLGLPVK